MDKYTFKRKAKMKKKNGFKAQKSFPVGSDSK